jgi:hypothetical protein
MVYESEINSNNDIIFILYSSCSPKKISFLAKDSAKIHLLVFPAKIELISLYLLA